MIRPPRLRPGDTVRLVSPASPPGREPVARAAAVLGALGLNVELGEHVFDEYGYLAGPDGDRLADLDDAFRSPEVTAVIATRGGKGAYRIAAGLDFAAIGRQPKLLIGFSDIVVLQLALLERCGLATVHGAVWDGETFGAATADSFVAATFATDPITVWSRSAEPTSALTTGGRARGRLIGGNQDSVATAAGWALPSLVGAILLLEAYNLRLGHIDRQLTMLRRAGHLDGIVGVAVGQYTDCGADAATNGMWSAIDVLRDQLSGLGVPILGGLPIGHGGGPIAVPLGTSAVLDADTGTLQIDSAVS